jgi:hypothetical protein
MIQYLYTAYDNGEPIGARTGREWADELHIPRQSIIDYARSGKSYRGRYVFQKIETDLQTPVYDLAEFKRSVKIGDRFNFESFRKDFVKGTRIRSEKMVVVRKYPHIVKLAGLHDPGRKVTMTYTELLEQKKAGVKGRKIKCY